MISDYLKLMRINNCLIAAFGVIIGIFIASKSYELNFILLLSALTVFLVVGGGNSLNDYFDYKIDKINKPDRPIPYGKINRKQALYFSFFLFIAGILLSLSLNMISSGIVIFAVILLSAYAKYSKSLSVYGNMMIAMLTGLIFIYAGSVVEKLNIVVIILAVCAALITFSRELIKDIEDIKGDKKIGALTLPIQIGRVKTKLVGFILVIPAVILGLSLYFIGLFSIIYLALIAIGSFLLIFSFTLEPAKCQRLMKISMVVVLLAFLFR